MFENNPALTGKIFGKSVYMTSGGLNPEMIEEIGRFAKRMFIKSVEKGREIIEKTKLYAPYKTLYKAPNGAKVRVSPFADKVDLQDNIKTAKLLADKLGVDVKIRPHINLQGYKNPEYKINGKIADRAEPTTKNPKRGISNTFDDKLGKGKQLRNFDKVGLVIDISHYDLTNENIAGIISQSWSKFNLYNKTNLKEVIFVHKNNAVILEETLLKKDFQYYELEFLQIRKSKK